MFCSSSSFLLFFVFMVVYHVSLVNIVVYSHLKKFILSRSIESSFVRYFVLFFYLFFVFLFFFLLLFLYSALFLSWTENNGKQENKKKEERKRRKPKVLWFNVRAFRINKDIVYVYMRKCRIASGSRDAFYTGRELKVSETNRNDSSNDKLMLRRQRNTLMTIANIFTNQQKKKQISKKQQKYNKRREKTNCPIDTDKIFFLSIQNHQCWRFFFVVSHFFFCPLSFSYALSQSISSIYLLFWTIFIYQYHYYNFSQPFAKKKGKKYNNFFFSIFGHCFSLILKLTPGLTSIYW